MPVHGPITRDEFMQWLDTSNAGDRIVYFVGHSLGDASLEAMDTATAAKLAYASGKVELVQARRDGLLHYLAIRREKVRVPKANGTVWLPYISQDAVMASLK